MTSVGQHPICDPCETVAHCSKHGCIPLTPTSFIKQCKAIDAAKRLDAIAVDEGVDFFAVQGTHDLANARFLARLNELLAEKRAA